MTQQPILEVRGVTKSFGPIHALRGVDFRLLPGEIHALAGENGAGKSTLMNIIDGILQPTGGEILWQGRPVRIASPTAAQALGIGFVHQEIALCPDVSVAENIFMAATNISRSPLMDYRALERRAAEILSQICAIDPRRLAGDLPIAEQQLVEIAKALTLDCKVLILDEPTAALSQREAEALFRIMRRLADRGIAIIYISHRMAEIFDNCDRVTVFRDGQYITTMNIPEITPDDVVKAMVGRVIDDLYPPKASPGSIGRDTVLEVRNLTDRRRFHDVSFRLRKGEILGIGGLIGAGRSEIVRGICRLEGAVEGEVSLNGHPLALRDYSDSIRAGLVYLSEDRKGDGVFLDMAIAANVSALDIDRVANAAGIISDADERAQAEALGRKLNLKYGCLSDPVASLSGGNQQKVAIAKMLAVGPKVIFLDEPTRGVDVGAKAEIHRILRDLAGKGTGIVVISSEMPELIGLCDRVIVVCEGRISGEVEGLEMTEENIMQLASAALPRGQVA
ncbi:sugar ABC transporter ATP-binding protein [Paracoccus sp. PAR01]|uniref:sugar ABC transporter ATP-binding protein n=1 Tax=Paracoccus sp. PAR01 TaxID=2769282 RepID=UPI00177D396B|nr:sugar ABC transporter ATP-binding protein [Paracoccus sp. PAR01]MBD9529518.1 sugar ABC transporter ATP-binding protein [Paracoccus sp. PAR01]